MQLTNKVKIFCWKACKGIIPTRSLLFFRGIIPSECCACCEEAAESADHVLWRGGLVHNSGLVGQAGGDRVEVPTTKQTAVGVGASGVLEASDVHSDFAVVCGGVLEPSSEQILLNAGGVFSGQVLQVSGGDFLAFSRQLEQVAGGAVLASSRQFLQAVVGVIGQAPRPSVGGLSGQSVQASSIVSLANSGLFQQVVQGSDGGVVLPSSG
ncbi:hypothetical protein ACOSP7_026388 [Xanthoceras sorbifolium]